MFQAYIRDTFPRDSFYWQITQLEYRGYGIENRFIFSGTYFKTKEEAHKDLVLTLKKLLAQAKTMEI